MDKTDIRSILICGAVSISAFLLCALIPAASLPIMLFLICPYVLLSYEHGASRALLCCACVSIVIYLLIHPLISFAYFISFGASGALIGMCAKKAHRFSDMMLLSISISIISKLCAVFIVHYFSGVNIFIPNADQIEQILSSIGDLGISSGGSDTQTINDAIPIMIDHLSILVPSTLILFSAAETLASIALASKLRTRRGASPITRIPHFHDWSFPKNILLVLLVGYVLGIIAESNNDNAVLAQVGTNLSMIARILFIIQGLAAACFFLERRNFPKTLRIVIIVAVLIIPFLGDVFSIVGILDLGLDLRKKYGGRNE